MLKGKLFWVLLGITLLAMILGLIKYCNKPEPKPLTPIEVYKTDTVYVPVYITDTLWRGIPVKPKTIIVYTEPQEREYARGWKTSKDTVWLINESDTIFQDDDFFRHHPKAPKLLEAHLLDDELKLSLLESDDTTKTHIYPIDLNHYQYHWVDGKLEYKPIKTKRRVLTESYLYTTYNPFSSRKILAVDYTISYGRLGITNRLNVSDAKPNFDFQTGLRVRIK